MVAAVDFLDCHGERNGSALWPSMDLIQGEDGPGTSAVGGVGGPI
jgi:hypothetical protein